MGADKSVPYVRAGVIAPVPDVIVDHGGDVDRPFRAAGVPVELASEPDLFMAWHSYLVLLEEAAREADDEHLGIALGERFNMSNLGPLGRLIASAPTLHEAIRMSNALENFSSSKSRSWLEVEGETSYWYYQSTDASGWREGKRIDGEYRLLLNRKIFRSAAGQSWQPDGFLLGPTMLHQLRAFENRLGVPARSVGDAFALVFPRNLLDLPMPAAKRLGQMERQVLLARLTASSHEDSFIGSMKAIVRGQLCGGYPSIVDVARSTGLSIRTVQRRLADEGVVYSDLVADVRRELAQELLADLSKSQIDITLSLGYSEAASFTRAFKHWTGQTPSAFRRSSLRSPAAA